ncbi:MAG TPA: PadR family transcriptional regulator [Acidimicrobiia bacterium]
MTPKEGAGLSITEWVVLGLLAEERAHGFALARDLSRETPLGQVWTVPRPMVYRAIGRLVEQGFVTEVGEEPGGPGPTRMIYEATGRGTQAAARWRAEPVRHLRDMRAAFLAKVLLRQRAGEPVGPLVAEQRSVFEPLFQRMADQFATGEGERVVTAWRYESCQAVVRLLHSVAALDRSGAARPSG